MNLKFLAVAALLASGTFAAVAAAADVAPLHARPVATGTVAPGARSVEAAGAATPSGAVRTEASRSGEANASTDTAVPFTESLALMLAGLGMIGFLASRRNVNR